MSAAVTALGGTSGSQARAGRGARALSFAVWTTCCELVSSSNPEAAVADLKLLASRST